MLRTTSLLSAFILAVLTFPTSAQISFGGEPYGLDRANALPEAPVVVMPEVDEEALKAEDAIRLQLGKQGPYRFGFNHVVDLGLDNSGVWKSLPNGDRVWRLGVECPSAYSINFKFDRYVVPEGARVFVYNTAGEVIGGFTAASNPGHQVLGVTQVPGERITIEYIEPANVAGRGELHIDQVTHAYRDIVGSAPSLNESGSCNNNVICPEGDPWRNQIRSVAMITVGGDGICTGQLINNCADDGTPYFLTARHCTQGENVGTWVFRFNWDSPTCSPTSNAPTNRTVSGATMRATVSNADAALIQLNSTPPESYNVFYTGWDKSNIAATSATAIHHPSGDIKKISFENQAVVSTTYGGAQVWKVNAWDDGTTEGGSSGSGLWNQNGLLVGQLYGGDASCGFNFNDYYGKLATSYSSFTQWLGDCGDQLEGYPLTTGLAEDMKGGQLGLYPNPTNGSVTISLPNTSGSIGIRVLDAVGRLVMENTLNASGDQVTVDLSGEPEGIYSVLILTAEKRYVSRLALSR